MPPFSVYSTTGRSLHLRHETSCLHYLHPFLFIGTKQGDVIVFKITERNAPLLSEEDSAHSITAITRTYNYKFISSTHVTANPIINISATANTHNGISSLPQTPLSSIINVLVLEGGDKSKIHMFELSLSSPSSHCSSPLSDITVVSSASLRNNGLTPGRLSVTSSSSDHYIPLKNE